MINIKLLPTTAGIYRFINFVNGKMYVGSAVNIKLRIKNHLLELRLSRHYNKYLQSAWSKYGEDNFVLEILEHCPKNKKILIEREQYWLDRFNCSDRTKGYNQRPIVNSPLGTKRTPEQIKVIIDRLTGRIVSEETKERIRQSNTGKKASPEARAAISKALKGRTLTEEHILNRTAARRNIVDWPCLNGYSCKCRMCMDKRAAIMREHRKSKMENK